jgi:hypothetical protein
MLSEWACTKRRAKRFLRKPISWRNILIREHGFLSLNKIIYIPKKEKGQTRKKRICPAWVVPTGGVSNFLFEDFDAVWKFMDAEMQKKKLSLK